MSVRVFAPAAQFLVLCAAATVGSACGATVAPNDGAATDAAAGLPVEQQRACDSVARPMASQGAPNCGSASVCVACRDSSNWNATVLLALIDGAASDPVQDITLAVTFDNDTTPAGDIPIHVGTSPGSSQLPLSIGVMGCADPARGFTATVTYGRSGSVVQRQTARGAFTPNREVQLCVVLP